MATTILRYWGSYFKNPYHGCLFSAISARAAERGWRTFLVCSRPPNDPEWLTPVCDAGTTIEYLPRPRRNFDQGCALRVFKLCRRLRCDVFHCDNTHTSPLIGSSLAGVPVRLWSKRAMNPVFEACRAPTLRDRLAPSVRVSCTLATRTLAVSRAVADELAALGIPARKIVVFPNPIDRGRKKAIDPKKSRVELGYGDDELVITTVGQALPVKGWDILIEAFARIAADVPAARLLLVGSTQAAQERATATSLRRQIERFGLTHRVRLLGRVQDVFGALAASDVFVLPSRSEGDSNALREALLAGLPCLSTRVGSAADVIRPGENGLLVDREDVSSLAGALRGLASDPELRTRLASGAASARIGPSLEEYAEQLMSLYESLLEQRGRRCPVTSAGPRWGDCR